MIKPTTIRQTMDYTAERLEQVVPECRALVAKIEELLAQRRSDAVYSPHAWKRWTREELCDVAYSSYKMLLSGRVRYPPRHSLVMDIADYLECTLAQRNTLLLAAGYAPQRSYLEGATLAEAIALAQQVIAELPLPAYVVTRDWNIVAFNDHVLMLFGLTHEQIEAIPPIERNILQLIFDPTLPIRARFSVDMATWKRVAMRNIYLFKFDNLLSQHDHWYHERVERLLCLPDFAMYWQQVHIDNYDDDAVDLSLDVLGPDGVLLHLRPLRIQPCTYDYPQVWAYQPGDDYTRQVLQELR